MDGRVLESFPRPEDVLHYGSFAESVRAGKGVVFILVSDSTCCKLSIDPGRRKGSEACVLYKLSA